MTLVLRASMSLGVRDGPELMTERSGVISLSSPVREFVEAPSGFSHRAHGLVGLRFKLKRSFENPIFPGSRELHVLLTPEHSRAPGYSRKEGADLVCEDVHLKYCGGQQEPRYPVSLRHGKCLSTTAPHTGTHSAAVLAVPVRVKQKTGAFLPHHLRNSTSARHTTLHS